MDDDIKELTALVVSFLTTNAKEYPSGFELEEFKRLFPKHTEEPPDWFNRYGCSNALDAVKKVSASVKIEPQRGGGVKISLNTRSEAVDDHILGMVKGQKASSKRKGGQARSQSQRVLDSFAINRRSSGHQFGRPSNNNNNVRSRLNQVSSSYQRSQVQYPDNRSGWGQPTSASSSVPPRQTIYKDQVVRTAVPGDPRARQSSSQVRQTPSGQSYPLGPPPTKLPASGPPPMPSISARRPPSLSSSSNKQAIPTFQAREQRVTQAAPQPLPKVDSAVEQARAIVKQRLVHLLNGLRPGVNMLFVPYLYQREFDEPLNPAPLGFKSLTQLYQAFSDCIKISHSSAKPMVSAIIGQTDAKENIASTDGNNRSSSNHHSSGDATSSQTENKENAMSTGKAKFNAIDPFNVSTMLQSLEPLRKISEPQLGSNKVEDIVKYRTMRIIFKDPEMTLKLEDWERRYQQEWNCSNRVRIHDYGYKTLLEFFKGLSKELPFKIKLKDDEWIAIGDVVSLSGWLKKQVHDGQYRAVTVIDAKYEHIAFPGDKYNYLDFESLQLQPYYSSIKTAVKSAYKMCLQMGSSDRVDDNITFETSSSCYDDYKRKQFFTIPEGFLVNGWPCAAYDESEQRWCRAIVVDPPTTIVKTTSISCFLVDYAVTKVFKVQNLLCILKNHLKYPVNPLQPIKD